VNPADVTSDALRRFSGSYFPLNAQLRKQLRGVADVHTPFVAFHDLYAGRCVEGPAGYRYLAISIADPRADGRENPVDFGAMPFKELLGLHTVDFQIPQQDLIDIVRRAESAPLIDPR
jgi:hypothetical protein